MDKLFDTKRRYTDSNGDEYIDMVIPVVDISKIQGNASIRVNDDERGRLDNFVWRNVAKNMDMIDIVMYANHIFNPFSIEAGDVLYVPVDNDKVYVSGDEPSLPDGSKNSSKSKGEKKMTYAEKVEYLARQGLGLK